MYIQEITCSMGRTINSGNYESIRVDVSGSARLAEDEDIEGASAALQAWVKKELTQAIPLAKGVK